MESFRFQPPDYRKCRVDDGILDRTNLADV